MVAQRRDLFKRIIRRKASLFEFANIQFLDVLWNESLTKRQISVAMISLINPFYGLAMNMGVGKDQIIQK
jgi:hypothetical protein